MNCQKGKMIILCSDKLTTLFQFIIDDNVYRMLRSQGNVKHAQL